MKTVIVTLLTGIGILCSLPEVNAREFTEHQNKEFTITGNASGSMLFIYNISGFIKVEGYQGNKILLEMDKTISADNDKDLETG